MTKGRQCETSTAFMTSDEVIAFLRVNPRTLYRLIRGGDFPAVRVGRQWRFRRSDLETWLNRGRPAD
jgi:excisionase family DNA binding protein